MASFKKIIRKHLGDIIPTFWIIFLICADAPAVAFFNIAILISIRFSMILLTNYIRVRRLMKTPQMGKMEIFLRHDDIRLTKMDGRFRRLDEKLKERQKLPVTHLDYHNMLLEDLD